MKGIHEDDNGVNSTWESELEGCFKVCNLNFQPI